MYPHFLSFLQLRIGLFWVIPTFGVADIFAQQCLKPDYSGIQYWAAHPQKYDFSDSVPKPYVKAKPDTTVDVFFVHPTSYLSPTAVDVTRLNDAEERTKWNACIFDEKINAETEEGSMLNQASVFNCFRVFAPRYRQAHIKAFYLHDSVSAPFFDTAYSDVKASFLCYLENENNGRPFIIAAHSQGTLHAMRLMKELVEGQPLQEKLIAAYLIGLPVPSNYFSSIGPCTTANANACIASWRTFKKGFIPEYVFKEAFTAIVVNPLNWTTSSAWASRKMNKGSVLFDFNKPKSNNVGAGIKGNILWSDKPRFFGNLFFTRKNYHIGDINLFWLSIRENALLRAKAWKSRFHDL